MKRRTIMLQVVTPDETLAVNHSEEVSEANMPLLEAGEVRALKSFKDRGWWNIAGNPEDYEFMGMRLILRRKAEKC
jgi:hypothetical protein